MTQLIYSALPQPRRPLVSVPPVVSVSQCITMMTNQNIGALAVLDEEKIVGIVSERDIVRASIKKNFDLYTTTALEIAYPDFSVLDLNEPVELAMEVITKTKRRHVFVSDDGELVAILSIGDLLFFLLEDKTRVIEQLENYIHSY
ncbi:MAG: CBS domain-containing protein [Tatlockia sp.]|nr:CBS domain-containing protein [Tatlockia sp.]